jgi:hypothetical protein
MEITVLPTLAVEQLLTIVMNDLWLLFLIWEVSPVWQKYICYSKELQISIAIYRFLSK